MPTSTIPAFKAALFTALKARANLANVQVTYGPPLPQPTREWIWLGDVDGQQDAAAFGHFRREETFALTVLIGVTRGGTAQQDATERAFTIAADIENELRTNADVAATVRLAEIKGPLRLEELQAPDSTSVGAHLTITIRASARI